MGISRVCVKASPSHKHGLYCFGFGGCPAHPPSPGVEEGQLSQTWAGVGAKIDRRSKSRQNPQPFGAPPFLGSGPSPPPPRTFGPMFFFCPVCHFLFCPKCLFFLSRLCFFCPECIFLFCPPRVCLFCPVSVFFVPVRFFCPGAAFKAMRRPARDAPFAHAGGLFMRTARMGQI